MPPPSLMRAGQDIAMPCRVPPKCDATCLVHAFAGAGDFATGIDADAIGIQEQTGHQGRVKRGSAAKFLLVGGRDGGEVELGHEIEEEKNEVVFRKLGIWAV